jgi:hypothetical protein
MVWNLLYFILKRCQGMTVLLSEMDSHRTLITTDGLAQSDKFPAEEQRGGHGARSLAPLLLWERLPAAIIDAGALSHECLRNTETGLSAKPYEDG